MTADADGWERNTIVLPVSREMLADMGYFREGSPDAPRRHGDGSPPPAEVQERVPCDDDDCPCDGEGHWETVTAYALSVPVGQAMLSRSTVPPPAGTTGRRQERTT